ncbi:Putative ribonuclease H protein At1g65750 [Linum perenne]
MERLRHLIEEEVAARRWHPIILSPGGPQLSHLFYADDIIFFSETSVEQAAIILGCLDEFCDASGLCVSKEKSTCFCSPNTSSPLSSSIADTLGFPLTQNLGKYLGVPVLHKRVLVSTYQSILDKIESKLSGWKEKFLSLAGRVTVAQAVLVAIPAYAMQTSVLLVTTC